jgi:pimeloyl-ACP methyl ester carboxylesterase
MPFLSRHKVSLYYRDTGEGAPPILLVHGWCCNHQFMSPLLEHFECQSRCIAVDLRGHGRSDKPVQKYSIGTYADDLAWIVQTLDLEAPVLIGHSMGGAIGFELAARHPEMLSALVLLDSAVPPSPTAWANVHPALEGGGARQPRMFTDFIENTFFLPTDSAACKSWVTDAMTSTPYHVMESTLRGAFEWHPTAPLGDDRCAPPVLYIAAARPRADLAALRDWCLHLETGQVVGSGHFLQLLVPDQVNAMITRFLDINLGTGRA